MNKETGSMTPPTPTFKLTYWGVTGTLTTPLLPGQVADKVLDGLCLLLRDGALENLPKGEVSREAVAKIVHEKLPFHLRATYGGNTTCIEVDTPDMVLIFDCGSGFRELGYSLLKRWQSGALAGRETNILISHAHMDHTYGTPFFLPYYEADCNFNVYSLQVVIDSLAAVLSPESFLSRVYFPPTYSEMKASIAFNPVTPGSEFYLGSTLVKTYALTHPGGALAFRIENSGRSIVIATDHEHPESPDLALADFARGADLLYTDGQYRRAEYEGKVGVGQDPAMSRKGWGHSPVEACVKTAVAAEVGILHVGHREPRRSDEQVWEFDNYLKALTADELAKLNRPPDACRASVPYEGLQVLI
jgi:phosphoribosyl 1,2-cyclic phosphodiesterase